MTLWLNKKEKAYLEEIVGVDMDYVSSETLTAEEKGKLLQKIRSVKI